MDYEHPFVQEVRANPYDDAPRLIFADYLEEAGDPQAELIRVQVELSHLPPGEPARRELELREQEILEEYGDAWLAPLRELGAEGVSQRCFQRGLIERVRISAATFLQQGVELCRIAPALHSFELRAAAAPMGALADAPLPQQVTQLDFRCNRFAAADLVPLVSAGWREQLVGLSFALCSLDDAAIGTLLTGDWPRLERLDVSVNRLGPEAFATLASRHATPQLKSLLASVNRAGDLGLAHLANSSLAGVLRELDLGTNAVTAVGLLPFGTSPLMAGLETLVLRGNVLGEGASEALAALARAPNLKRLDLRGTHRETSRYGYGAIAEEAPAALKARLGEDFLW